MRLHNVGSQTVKGVKGVRYEMMPEFFANRTENPSNGCFDGGREWPSGVFNVSACRFKAPVFLSQPHFYQADPWYVSQFSDGSLSPDKDAHSTYFVIDPTSGIPLSVVARFQVNMFVEPIKELTMFKHLKDKIFFPAFWFETTMVLDDSMKGQLWILSNIQSVMIAIGVGMALLTIGILIVIALRQMATKGSSPLLPCHLFRRGDADPPAQEEPEESREEISDNSVSPLIRKTYLPLHTKGELHEISQKYFRTNSYLKLDSTAVDHNLVLPGLA